ncbi:MAG: phenylalanine--tRNA ligase subunit beta, partial [Clostridia bacterium]|nr:phenylalanine--tRNA ligase subunit beta [Clostridia bacterium]
MLVSMNWIKEYVDLSGLDCEALIHQFTLSTAEVEDIIYKGRDLSGVIVARIVSVENHPNSKKLHLLKIDTGSDIRDCVCGAPNVREGMTVAFATAGGSVGGMEIRTAMVGGYESQGMCCSEAELGISADHSGLMELPDDLTLGTDIKTLFAIEDTIFEVDNKSLTNRPDLWGHYGIAREFAALTGRALKPVDVADCSAYKDLPAVAIESKEDELLYRYTSVKLANIKTKVSPINMRIRLFYCGVRAINLLTDLTNYIMLELGQPMHAFDLRRVSSVCVRRFADPFEFQTLDGTMRAIDQNTLMICTGDTPVAIAGVMGGLDSEIEDDTDSCLIESANFDGVSVRKTSSRLGLRTDASMRYEKVLDPELTIVAAARFIKLATEIDSGVEVISSVTDCYVRHYDKITIDFDKAFVDRYTGIDLPVSRIENTLTALGFGVRCDGVNF